MSMTKEKHNKLQVYFLVGLFIIVTWLLVMIFKPFLSAITIAAILAVVLYPWYRRLVKALNGRRSIAALLMIALLLLVVIVPLVIMGKQIFDETFSVYQYLSRTPQLQQLPSSVEESLHSFAPDLTLEFNTYVRKGVDWLLGNLGHIFSSTLEIVFGIFLVLISLYFFLKDGKQFRDWLIKISPLDDRYDKTIFSRLHQTVYAVVVGTLAIALVQGILVSLGLLIFGVPNFMLWGMVAALSALVPGIGTGLVSIPAVLYLFFAGKLTAAVGLAVWSIALVGLVDNILLPFFYSHGNHVHPLLILFAVLGGLAFFGPVGFLLGPIILSIFLALIQIYELFIGASARRS